MMKLPTQPPTIMTTIIIDMSSGSTASRQLRGAIRHTKAVTVSGLVSVSAAVLSPDAQSRRSSHRGNKWRFPGLGESNVRIAPIHARRRSGLPSTLALPIATILTSVADGHLSQFLDWRQDERDRWPRPLRPCQRSGRSDRDRRPGPGLRTGGALARQDLSLGG